MNRSIFPLALCVVLSAVFPAHGADEKADSLRVVRTFVHGDRKPAEMCLEFNQLLDPAYKKMRTADNVMLEAEGEKVTLSYAAISSAGNQLCVTGLRHRTDYQLTIKSARAQRGDKLAAAYKIAFRVPARKASLSLVGQGYQNNVLPLSPPPKVQSVNVEQIDLELYAIEGLENIGAAWNLRRQAAVAPTEALYLAQHKGKKVWQTSLHPKNEADDLGLTLLDNADFEKQPPGLYVLVASSSAQAETTKNSLRPMAAAWLMRSDIQAEVVRDASSYYLFASNAAGPLPNMVVALLDQDQKILRKEATNAKGIATLPLADRSTQIIALADNGSPAIVAVSDDITNVTARDMQAGLSFDRTTYAPSEKAIIHLLVRGSRDQPSSMQDSIVRIWWPDGRLYQQMSVRLEPSGAGKISFTVPAQTGVWRATWQGSKGALLAEKDFNVSDRNVTPILEVKLGKDAGDLPESIRVLSRHSSAVAVPYVAGHLTVTAQAPGNPFPNWPDYHFGDGKVIESDSHMMGAFVTDAHGVATPLFDWSQHDQIVMPHQWLIEAKGDAVAQAVGGSAIFNQLPDTSIGVQPKISSGKFPENSVARFSVIALDRAGQRQAVPDIWYQIYEQGRLFSWRQADGRWDAKPVENQRRIASGRLSVSESNSATLEVPVVSGSYRLEITNEEGVVLAGLDFSAGWSDSQVTETENLELKLPAKNPEAGKTYSLTAFLPKDAWVTATLADDHSVRASVQGVYKAGEAIVSLLPVTATGPNMHVRVAAHYADGSWATGKKDIMPPLTLPVPSASSPQTPLAESEKLFPILDYVTQIEGQKSWKANGVQKQDNKKNAMLWLAAISLEHLPNYVTRVLNLSPVTAGQIAAQVDVATLLAPLLGLDKNAEKIQHLKIRLLTRQNSDGGFGPEPSKASSLEDTIASVMALSRIRDETIQLPLQSAVGWLHRYLDNVWFDEADRSPRAMAYAALGAANAIDAANLHYFSDVSADKTMTPAAMAALANAFASLNDRPASEFWFNKILSTDLDAAALALLASNPFVSSSLMQEKLRKITPVGWADTAAYVEALIVLAQRDEMHAMVDKNDIAWHGIASLSTKTTVIENSRGERPLSLAQVSFIPSGKRNAAVRKIYRLDGRLVEGALKKGETYLVMLEAMRGTNRVVVHENPAPMLIPLTCPLAAHQAPFLTWLSNEALADILLCEKTANALDVVMKSKEKDNGKLVYLARATGVAGRPTLPESAILPAVNRDDKDGQR